MFAKRRIGHPGTSIVEILVAMVILLIGIFAIIRIFPTGFGMILYGEKVSQGQKLANAALEHARTNAENLPDAVVPVNPVNGSLDDSLTPAIENHDFVLDALRPEDRPNPNQRIDPRFVGFNRTRRIFGETTKIPPPTANVLYMPVDATSNQRELVSIYTLQYGPLYSPTMQPPGIGGLVVYSGRSLDRVIFTQDPSTEQVEDLGVQRYGIDYRRAVLYFAPVAYPRRYKVQYSYVIRDQAGPFRAQSRPDQFVDLPAGARGAPIPIPNGAVLEPGEEQVFRAFDQIALNVPFSNRDPYQFKLLNSFVGIVGFNPLAAISRRRSGSRGITAKIDYDVDDWSILSEERTVPAEAPHRVKLTLNFIKHVAPDEFQADQELYTGLMASYPGRPGLTGIDLIVVDLETGRTLDSRTLQADGGPGTSSSNGATNYRQGLIHFNPTVQWSMPPSGALGPAEPIAGKQIRIYYRTEDDFALQVQKAFTNYLRSAAPFTVTPGQYGQLPDGFLLFPASDHHQTVLVDYSFTQQLGPNQTRRLTVSGELQPIRSPIEAASPQNLSSLRAQVRPTDWHIRINNSPRVGANDPTGRPDVVPGSLVIHSVRGVSVRGRVAWREGTRWRRLENSTYLTRSNT